MGLDWKRWFIKVKLMTFAFAGQIFHFVARPGNVDNCGFNFTLRHPLNLWKAQNDTFENLVLGPKCIGRKLFRAEVFPGLSRHRSKLLLGLKYSSGWNVPRPKYAWGPKWVWGKSGLGAKLGVSHRMRSKSWKGRCQRAYMWAYISVHLRYLI